MAKTSGKTQNQQSSGGGGSKGEVGSSGTNTTGGNWKDKAFGNGRNIPYKEERQQKEEVVTVTVGNDGRVNYSTPGGSRPQNPTNQAIYEALYTVPNSNTTQPAVRQYAQLVS